MKKILLLTFCLFTLQLVQAQVPFHRGVNLTGWFQASAAQKIQFRKFTRKDFQDIKSLGSDAIRLPINLHDMTSGAPSYTIDPLLFSFLDSAVNWAEQLQLYLLIDNHSFDPATSTSADIGLILNKVWPQIAEHYKDRSNYIMYEVLNEPHGISNQLWGNIQQQSIDAIRSKDTKHTIIVGPSGYNSYNDLAQMPVYTDQNLIYTFHFYDPFIFTHQGATWNTPSMLSLAGVPFPYNAASMPPCPNDLKGTWVEQALNNYPSDGTIQKVKSLIDIAVNFRNARNVNIYCGEFGTYMPNSDTAHRVFWYKTVREYLEEKEIPWTIWDYKGSFGLFEKNSFERFESDLNIPLLYALGFNIPEQQTYIPFADSVGFKIYDDYLEQGINEASYSQGTIDYYSTLFPNNDHYCLYWSDGPQYTAITLDFVPDRNLTKLVNSGFAIDLLVRGNVAGTKFDIRFLDSKTTDPNDHPWRQRITINDPTPSWDKRWHHVHVPLNQFAEQGAWDNGAWYDPQGDFDWSAIDRLEIVSEYGSFENKEIWFDNIMVTDQDTATVLENGTLGIEDLWSSTGSNSLTITPNPLHESTRISYSISENNRVNLSVYNLSGQKIKELINEHLPSGAYSLSWNGDDTNGRKLPSGLYFCRLTAGNHQEYSKLIIPK